MNRKTKLAKLILLEVQALSEAQSVGASLALAEELTKDAIELAKIILREQRISENKEDSKLLYIHKGAA